MGLFAPAQRLNNGSLMASTNTNWVEACRHQAHVTNLFCSRSAQQANCDVLCEVMLWLQEDEHKCGMLVISQAPDYSLGVDSFGEFIKESQILWKTIKRHNTTFFYIVYLVALAFAISLLGLLCFEA